MSSIFQDAAHALLANAHVGPAARACVFVAPVPEVSCMEIGAWDRLQTGSMAVRRWSGGVPMHVGPGVVGVSLLLPREDGVGPERVVNHASRPVLAWLKGMGVPAKYLGRDALTVGPHEVARFGLTGDASTFLLEMRVAHAAPLDVPGQPTPTPLKPGDRKPSGSLLSVSGRVPLDATTVVEDLLRALVAAGAHRMETPQAPSGVGDMPDDVWGPSIQSPLGAVCASSTGRLAGPFNSNVELVDDVQAFLAAGMQPRASVERALERPGAFLWGADAHHLVAALEAGWKRS